jgi:hypothetical protein
VLGSATERLAAFFVTTWPQLPDKEARIAAQCTVRLAISHALLPTAPTDLAGASVAALVGPYLEQPIARS